MSLAQLEVHADGPAQLNRFGVTYRGKRMFCMWPWRTMVLTCDGHVVCGCGDARNENKMGHIATQSVMEIWQGDGFQKMRGGMHQNRPPAFCYKCGLMEVHEGEYQPPDLPLVPQTYPKVLYVEPTIVCNLRCPQPACEVDVYDTRTERLLPFELYKKAIDEVGPHIERMVFYNYGESFLHKDAFRMLKYAKTVNPDVWIWTSTNGHYFDKPEKVAALVDSGLNEVQFSIDGATQAVYETYRKRGNLDRVLKAIGDVVEERERRGERFPWIIWNYILFRWNDSDEEMEKARSIAKELGVDRLTFTTTDQPPGFPSQRFVPGSPDYERIRHALLDGGRKIPNALVWDARIEPLELPRTAHPGDLFVAKLRVTNTGEMPWLPPGDRPFRKVFLVARLYDAAGTLLDDTLAQIGMGDPVEPGESRALTLLGLVPRRPGRYLLKADLVRQGLWWFENLGVVPIEWQLEVIDPPATARGPDFADFTVRVRGNSTGALDSADAPEDGLGRVGIGVRWTREGTNEVVRTSDRGHFEPPLAPGEVRDVSILVPVGALEPGRYQCRAELVREYCFWLGDQGGPTVSWTIEILPPLATGAGVEPVVVPDRVPADRGFSLRVRVRGSSNLRLDGTGPMRGRCGLGVRWFDAESGACVRDGERSYFSPALEPSEQREITIPVPAGALPRGRYRARIGILKEELFWFESRGTPPLDVTIEVT